MKKLLSRLKNLFFDKEKILLAFEYGVVLGDVARDMGVSMDPELIKRAEAMIEGEFKNQTASHLSTNIVPNIMTAFELDLSK